MVTQQDVEQIERELDELRTLLMTTRDRVRPRLEELVHRTETLQGLTGDGGSDFLPTLNSVHELLLAFRRGFEVTDCLRARKAPPRQRASWQAAV